MAQVKFMFGVQDNYNSLATKETDALYFITDTQRIYKGDVQLADVSKQQVVFTSTTPEAGTSEEGILYVATVDGQTTLYVKSGESMVQAGGGEAQSVADGVITFDSLNTSMVATAINGESPSETKVPTEKAVKDYVDGVRQALQTTIDTAYDTVEIVGGGDDHPNQFGIQFSRIGDTNPTTIYLDKEQYLLDATVEEREVGEPPESKQCVVLKVQVLDGQGGTTSREVVIPVEDFVQVNASTVDTTQTITVTTPVGNYTKGQTIPVSDIQSILMNMLSTDSWPTITNPSVSTPFTPTSGGYEVGTKVTPTYNSNFSAGSYGQTAADDQVATGITPIVWTATCTGQAPQTDGTAEQPTSSTNFNGTFNEITVVDDTNVVVGVSATYTAATAGPKTYLGNSELDGVTSDQKKIQAGTASRNANAITGYRKMFYGRTTNAEALDKTEIRALTGEKAAKKQLPEIAAQVGDRQVLVAYPSTLTTSDPTFEYFTLSWGPFEGFVKSTIQVDGVVPDQNATEYTVWSYTAAAPLDAVTRFRITIN